MAKMQPSVMRMTFDLPGDVYYLDISQCASILNRRFYRQGLNWAVAGITFVDEAGGAAGTVEVTKLHNNWVTSNAWEKSMRLWNRMNKEFALDDHPSVKPRYYDFKVHFDTSHVAGGFAQNLRPRGYSVAQIGEWLPSEISIPDIGGGGQSSYPLKMIGVSNASAKGVIEGYQDSRAVPTSPDPEVPSQLSLNWMSSVFREGTLQTNAILGDLEDTNDETPYDLLRYPGAGVLPTGDDGEVVDTIKFTGTTVSSRNRIGGFNAPCGLIRINQLAGPLVMYLDLVPGDHKGYLCQKMTEM